MRFIDEKGRLFGLINTIDFLVIVFLLSIIPAIYFGYQIIIMQRPEPLIGNKFKEVYLNCEFVRLTPKVANKISVNDKELSSRGVVMGQIMELGGLEPYKDGQSLKKCRALLRLKLKFKETDLFYGDALIDFGSELIFKTNKYTAVARVNDELIKMLKIHITLRDLDEHTATLVKAGDKEIDSRGNVIAEILKSGKPVESFREVELNRGGFTIAKIINKKQIVTEMVLRCQEIGNEIYFKGSLLTYDLSIEFVTDRYKAKGFLATKYKTVGGGDVILFNEDMAEE